jgi:hypothetical protein
MNVLLACDDINLIMRRQPIEPLYSGLEHGAPATGNITKLFGARLAATRPKTSANATG